jgi:hypothetical protein
MDGDEVDVGSGPGKIRLFRPIPWPVREMRPHWEYGDVRQKQIFSVSYVIISRLLNTTTHAYEKGIEKFSLMRKFDTYFHLYYCTS